MSWRDNYRSFFQRLYSFSIKPKLSGRYLRNCVLAFLWLFGRGVETELEREESVLETRVAQRTTQLEQSQTEELQQLYRFTEVSQLSMALLHDVASHLTVLTLEIETIRSSKHAGALSRSRRIIGQLNTMLDEVRDRLGGVRVEQDYNLIAIIDNIAEFASSKYKIAGIRIDWRPPKAPQNFDLVGDPVKCSQAISILVNNAADSYLAQQSPGRKPKVTIRLEKTKREVRVVITDRGAGIAACDRDKVFQAAYSTKRAGMGVGLYLAKQMVTTEFSGSLTLSPVAGKTEFVVRLPLGKNIRKRKLQSKN